MEAADRPTTAALDYESGLQSDPYGRHPFQVLRRLEALYRLFPRIGTSRRAKDDFLRLRQAPIMGFAPSSIRAFERRGDKPPVLSLYGFGLFGPSGPLPLHLTDHAIHQTRSGDDSFEAFANIFHHRLLGLFYRAWASAEPTVQRDREGEDAFASFVASIAGLDLDTNPERQPLPSEALLRYVGHLSCPTRHPEGLRSILGDYFEVPVRVEEFVGQWEDLPESYRCRLGESEETGCLGETLTLGGTTWSRTGRFRLVIGPLGQEDYLKFLPPSESVERLIALVRAYIGEELAWDLRLIINRSEIPEFRLGGSSQLGFNCWLRTKPLAENPSDFLITPLERDHE